MKNRTDSSSFGPVALRYGVPSWLAFKLSLAVALSGLVLATDVFLHGPAGLIVETLFGPQPLYGPRGIDGRLVVVVGVLLLVAGIVAAVTTAASPRQRITRGVVETRGQTLYIDGAPVVSKPRGAAIVEMTGGYGVRVFDRPSFPRVTVMTETWNEAQELVSMLSDEEKMVASFRIAGLSTPAGRVAFITGIALIAVGGIAGVMSATPAWFLLGLIGVALMRIPANAVVGADGIVLSCLGLDSFIPFADIVRVERDYGVVIHRRDGRTVRIRDHSGDARCSLKERIDAVREGVLDTSMTEKLLVRGARTDEAWREDLQRLAMPGYRQAALDRERLWDILENGAADGSARLGAATILRAKADEADRARLLQVGAGIVSPELRIAYDELLDDPACEDDARRDTMNG